MPKINKWLKLFRMLLNSNSQIQQAAASPEATPTKEIMQTHVHTKQLHCFKKKMFILNCSY